MKTAPSIKWLASTIGKRGYIARYLRESSPNGSVVIGTGNTRYVPGFMSCDEAFVVPWISDPRYLDAIRKLVKREGINAIVSLSDLDLPVLSKLRDELSSLGVACFFPNYQTTMRFLDKYQAARFFNDHGFRTPATFDTLGEAVEQLVFPLVVKSRRGSASIGYRICRDKTEAAEHWALIEDPIAQEYVDGLLLNVEVCSDLTGVPIAASVWERKESVAGETLLTQTIEHEDAIKLVLNMLEVSPIPGPIDLDLIDHDGVLYILEVNTRFGGGYPGSHLAGADFTGAMVESLQGVSSKALCRYTPGITMLKELTPVVFDEGRVKSGKLVDGL